MAAGHSDEDSSWTSNEEEEDGVIRALLVEQLEEYDPRIFNIDFSDLTDLKRIGGGNFGQVWKAGYFGTKVAVKQLLDIDDADMHKYITREMLTLRDVRHPNVVQLMGLCKHTSGIYIVTEYIPGGHLRKLLKNRENELPWALRVRIAIDILMALTYLHSRGIVHRDLKSQNLLVDDGFRIKVCDFGFSRLVEKNEFMTVCGTDEWMAPEVRLGKMYDERADVFSYAMVLTELITRNKPVDRLPGRHFAFDAVGFRRTAPPDCPKGLVDLACAMAVSNPAERMGFKDGLKVLKQLKKELEGVERPLAPSPSRLSQAFDLTTIKVAMAEEAMAASSSASSAAAGPSQLVVVDKLDTPPSGRTLRARTEYTAGTDAELTLKQGDVVKLVGSGTGGLAGFVQAELNGKVGWLPEKVVNEYLIDDSSFSLSPATDMSLDRMHHLLSPASSSSADAEPKPKKKGKIARFFSRSKAKKATLEVGLNLSEDQMDDMIMKLVDVLPIGTHRHQAVVVDQSFIGSEGVAWLISNGFGKSKPAAVKLLKYLIQRSVIFSPVASKKGSDEFVEKQPYCLQPLISRQTRILNADKMWAGTTRPPGEVISSLSKQLSQCVRAALATSSPEDLNFLGSTREIRKLCLLACELQKVVLKDLSAQDLLTFWVNIRNFFVLLAIAIYPRPQSPRDRQTFFNQIRIYVGYHPYSLQEIESVMILGTAQFPAGDPRAQFAATARNQMILLALFDGNRSSPPFAYYTSKTFPDVLEEHIRPWLSAACSFNKVTSQLFLPKHLQRFSTQFGMTGLEILTLLTPYLPSLVKRFLSEVQQADIPLSLAYSDYDWSSSFSRPPAAATPAASSSSSSS